MKKVSTIVCVVICCVLATAVPLLKNNVDDEIVSVSHLGHFHHAREKRSVLTFPTVVSISIGRQTEPFVLRLIKNEAQSAVVPLTVFENGGIAYRHAEPSKSQCFYQDGNTGSSILLMCNNDGTSCQILGTFENGKERYMIEPINATDTEKINPHIVKRDTSQYTYQDDAVEIDKTELEENIRSNANREKRQTAVKTVHLVEIVAVIDSTLWKTWLNRNGGNDIAAEIESTTYYGLLGNSIDLRYKSVGEGSALINISATIIEIVIIKDDSDSIWSLGDASSDDSGLTFKSNGTLVLNAFKDWVTTNRDTFRYPNADHTMGFTGVHIYSSSAGSGLAGKAYTGSVCNVTSPTYSVSIVEHTGDDSSGIGAHELGHALSGSHDGSNACPDSSNVMTPISGAQVDVSIRKNPSLFSSCSIQEFEQHFLSPHIGTCTQYHVSGIDIDSIQNEKQLGEIYNPDQQCEQAFGDGFAQYISSGSNTSIICYDGIMCRNYSVAGSSFTYFPILAYSGTECGTDKWCQRGVCESKVTTTAAPTTSKPYTTVPTTTTTTKTTTPTTTTHTTTTPTTTKTITTPTTTTTAPTTPKPYTTVHTTTTTTAPTTTTHTTTRPTTTTTITTPTTTITTPTTTTPTTTTTTTAPTTPKPYTTAPTTTTTTAPATSTPTTTTPTTTTPTTTKTPVTTTSTASTTTPTITTTTATKTTSTTTMATPTTTAKVCPHPRYRPCCRIPIPHHRRRCCKVCQTDDSGNDDDSSNDNDRGNDDDRSNDDDSSNSDSSDNGNNGNKGHGEWRNKNDKGNRAGNRGNGNKNRNNVNGRKLGVVKSKRVDDDTVPIPSGRRR